MRMTSGLDLDETNSGFDPSTQMYLYEDMSAFAVSARMIAPVGARFHYSSATTQILARIIRDLLSKSLETACIENGQGRDIGQGGGSTAGDDIDWLTIKDLKQSVVHDVVRIRTHPLVPATIPIYGYVYDVATGRLIEVPEAREAGETDAQARAARN